MPESERERLNRELIELLNELRVVLPGVQVLFAFLLTIPFARGFPKLDRLDRDVYFAALLSTMLATILLLKLRNMPRDQLRRRVDEVLQMVRLDGLGERSAARLSGGQQQRVALARSIAFDPKALLLDEPLSNLDAKLRAHMRVELRELQRKLGVTSIYVTHDQEEALAISDRIIVMNAGHIEQIGTPGDIYDHPRSRFVADFIGASNIVLGDVDPQLSNGYVALRTRHGAVILKCAPPARMPSGEAAVSVRTVYPEIRRERPAGDLNVWPGRIEARVFLGDSVQYFVSWAGGTLTVRKLPLDVFDEGENIFVHIEPKYLVFVES